MGFPRPCRRRRPPPRWPSRRAPAALLSSGCTCVTDSDRATLAASPRWPAAYSTTVVWLDPGGRPLTAAPASSRAAAASTDTRCARPVVSVPLSTATVISAAFAGVGRGARGASVALCLMPASWSLLDAVAAGLPPPVLEDEPFDRTTTATTATTTTTAASSSMRSVEKRAARGCCRIGALAPSRGVGPRAAAVGRRRAGRWRRAARRPLPPAAPGRAGAGAGLGWRRRRLAAAQAGPARRGARRRGTPASADAPGAAAVAAPAAAAAARRRGDGGRSSAGAPGAPPLGGGVAAPLALRERPPPTQAGRPARARRRGPRRSSRLRVGPRRMTDRRLLRGGRGRGGSAPARRSAPERRSGPARRSCAWARRPGGRPPRRAAVGGRHGGRGARGGSRSARRGRRGGAGRRGGDGGGPAGASAAARPGRPRAAAGALRHCTGRCARWRRSARRPDAPVPAGTARAGCGTGRAGARGRARAHALLELGGALGGAAGPLAQALELARLGEDEQRQHRDPERARRRRRSPRSA